MAISFSRMDINLYIILCSFYFASFIQRCESKHCLETQPSCHLGWVSGNLSPCCQSHKPLYEIDHRQVMALGLTVICTCLVLTVTIVICCFWSRCPLYNTCRVNYTQGHIIAYSKEDDPFNSIMPPNPVKIKPVEDV